MAPSFVHEENVIAKVFMKVQLTMIGGTIKRYAHLHKEWSGRCVSLVDDDVMSRFRSQNSGSLEQKTVLFQNHANATAQTCPEGM